MWTEYFRRHWDWDVSNYVLNNSNSFEEFTGKNSQIAILDKKKSFCIKGHQKNEYFSLQTRGNLSWSLSTPNIQSFAMVYLYKWVIADVLSGKNNFSTVGPSYKNLWRGHGILFDIKIVRKLVGKKLMVGFLNFVYFLYTVFALKSIPHVSYRLKIFT